MADGPDEVETESETDLRPRLQKPRPLIAATVIALGSLIVMRLGRDLPYALSSRAPTPIDSSSAATKAPLPDDKFASLTGLPDRRNALYLSQKGSKSALLFFRLLGSESRLFVRAAPSTTKIDPVERWQGRLVRFDALPYAATLREFYEKRVSARRYLDLPPLWTSLAASPPKLVNLLDRTARPIEVTSDTEVELSLVFSDQLRILLPRSKYPTSDDAIHEVERLGLKPIALPEQDAANFVALVAAKPADRDALMQKLEAAQLVVRLRDLRTKVKLGQLSVATQEGSQQLVVPADLALLYAADAEGKLVRTTRLPLAAVTALSIDEPVKIPADAMVLLEDESPATMWWVPVVAGMALLFVLFNLFVLIRSLRRPA